MRITKLRSSIDDQQRSLSKDDGKLRPLDIPRGVLQTLEYVRSGQPIDDRDRIIPLIERREALFAKAQASNEFRKRTIASFKDRIHGDRAAEGIIQFVNDWVWTQDPRKKPSVIPFVLFPAQENYMKWRQDRRDNKEPGVIEKSRDMGATWLNVCYHVYFWLFEPAYKGAFGSRKAELVDKLGDPDCIFEKIRLLLMNLPGWMLPNYRDNQFKLINDDNGSTITGEGGDNMGRGGRSSIYDLDEFAFVERPLKVDAAVSNNSDVLFYTSTPNGTGNVFFQKRFGGEIPVFTFWWRDDPRKDDAWYAKKKKTLHPIVLAQEVDLDYHASRSGVLIPIDWIRAAINFPIHNFKHSKYAGGDVADEGGCENVLCIRKGQVVVRIESWAAGNTTQTANEFRRICEEENVKRLAYDAIGVGAGVGGTLNSTDNLGFRVYPFQGGASPRDMKWEEFNDRHGSEIFKNLRAEGFWCLRRRFEKTYEYIHKSAFFEDDEMISIPNHPTLISHLSQLTYKYDSGGHICIASKEEMAKEGLPSPDFADTLMYCFHNPPGAEEEESLLSMFG